MHETSSERQLEGVAPLADPTRRRLYLFVSESAGDVTREEAARALDISRPAATFHLEKLVTEGLIEAGYRRVSGRSGPGAGRPARVYRGPARELRVQIPGRDYELLARLLLEGIDAVPDAPKGAREAARRFGGTLGAEATRQAGSRPSRVRIAETLVGVLEERGFEPRAEDGEIRLGNCPFHALSRDHRDVVCSLNLSMMEGVIEHLPAPGVEAVLDPQPGKCCVVFRPRATDSR